MDKNSYKSNFIYSVIYSYHASLYSRSVKYF